MEVHSASQDRSDICYGRYNAIAGDVDGLAGIAVVAVLDTGVDVADDVASE